MGGGGLTQVSSTALEPPEGEAEDEYSETCAPRTRTMPRAATKQNADVWHNEGLEAV